MESGAKRVQHLTAKGRPLASWGTQGRNDGQFREPIGVAVAPSGEVFIVDDQRDDIQAFSADGTYRRTIGGPGSAPGQLYDTGNIRIGGQGNLVNADFGNGRVQAWDSKGQLLWTLGSKGTGPGQFNEPQDVAFGPDGRLLVVDDARVQVFNSQRELVGVWPAAPSPDHLGALALDGDRLWVEAPYPNKFFKLKVSWTPSTARVAPTRASDQPNSLFDRLTRTFVVRNPAGRVGARRRTAVGERFTRARPAALELAGRPAATAKTAGRSRPPDPAPR